MKKLLLAFLILAVCVAGPAWADERTDVLTKITNSLLEKEVANLQVQPQEKNGDEAVTFTVWPNPKDRNSFSCVYMIGREKVSFVSIWNGTYGIGSKEMDEFLAGLNRYTKYGKFAINEEGKLIAFAKWVKTDPATDVEDFMKMGAWNVSEFYMFLDLIKAVSGGAPPAPILNGLKNYFDGSDKKPPERKGPAVHEEKITA